MFEAEDDTYVQHAPKSTTAQGTDKFIQDDGSSSAAVDPNVALSPPTQLLVRLINDGDFEAARTVLTELRALDTPYNESHPIYASAALWAIRNGKKADMLTWMRFCPGFVPGAKGPKTASSSTYSEQARSTATHFRKCFLVLLDSYGDDLKLLQRAGLIAAEKRLWGVLQSTLAQILRFGVGRVQGSDPNDSGLAWQFFFRPVQASVSQRGLNDNSRRYEISTATLELRKLYNLGIRTLVLAGRFDDAIHWAKQSVRAQSDRWLSQYLTLDPFTENLLLEELVRAGDRYLDRAYRLSERLASSPHRSAEHQAVNIQAIVAQVERETTIASSASEARYEAGSVDNAIEAHLAQGDIVAARDYLLSVLRSATRARQDEDAPTSSSSSSKIVHDSVYSHLPSARFLSELQDMASKLGTIAVTVPLTEPDMDQKPDSDISDQSLSQESLTAEEFLLPIRAQLFHVRAGKGLWETARLNGLVRKGQWREAVQYYVGRAGFKMPAGGVTTELISLALDQQTLPTATRREIRDSAQGHRGKLWPSTPAINLLLKAVAGLCVDAKDYPRLVRVYKLWKETSLATPALEDDAEDGLVFEQWPPSQRPDSRTFDPFIRAFARLDMDVDSPSSSSSAQAQLQSKVKKEGWGSSQAVLDVIRDMTDLFRVRPSISTWTIALECLAREGPERWATTTSILARAVGINTNSPLSPHSSVETVAAGAEADFAPANLATYTALIRALIRVGHDKGGSMVEQAAAVRDDLLARTVNLDVAVRPMVEAEKEEEDGEATFWTDTLKGWQAVQEAVQMQQGGTKDQRERWEGAEVVTANQGRTVEAMRELWLLEVAKADSEASGNA